MPLFHYNGLITTFETEVRNDIKEARSKEMERNISNYVTVTYCDVKNFQNSSQACNFLN